MQERVYLKDYTSPTFSVDDVHLSFQIFAEHTFLRNRLKLKSHDLSAISFDGHDFELLNWKIDGREPVAGEFEFVHEGLKLFPKAHELEVEFYTKLLPNQNKSLEGLYVSGGCLVTQCESQGFRRLTYYPDRPDVMSFFTVDIEADKDRYPVLLSNGDRLSSKDIENNRHQVQWRDPFKKPSYLFAVVACDFGVLRDEFVTHSGKKVDLEIYSSRGLESKCTYAMAALKKAMAWDEKRFGLEYDLNTYMIVAIDGFNAGAMENKGLNIFNVKYILADKESATDEMFQQIDAVVGHEYFHNYTGNRVTLRDWFQLTLKEGLTVFRDQEFSADIYDREVVRLYDVQRLMTEQFPEDEGPNSHPIRPESYLSVDNFFTTTIYDKGSEVIRMAQTLLGRESFSQALKYYLQKHDGQGVTAEDFLTALSESSHFDLKDFAYWYSEAGTPHLIVREEYDAKSAMLNISIEQKRPGSQQALVMPIKIKAYLDGKEVLLEAPEIHVNSDRERMVILRQNKQQMRLGPFAKPPTMTYLHGLSAPVRLEVQRTSNQWLEQALIESDSFLKQSALNELSFSFWKTEGDLGLKNLLSAYGGVIDSGLSDYQKAIHLSFPEDALLIQNLSNPDFERLDTIRARLEKIVGHQFKNAFDKIARTPVSDDLDVAAMGQRALTYRAQYYLAMADSKEILQLLLQQLKSPRQMTEEIMSLRALSKISDSSEFAEGLEIFEKRWSQNRLVMNNWLAIQAQQRTPNLLGKIQQLMGSPQFDIENPNNVYSLLLQFGKNWSEFYREPEPNFSYLMEQILKIDKFNPSVAARLMSVFQFVGKLSVSQRNFTESLFGRALKKGNLSKNVQELLEKHHKAVVASLAV